MSLPSVAIIGAGISGICAAIQLKVQLGYTSFFIFEKEKEIGGTWWVNTYPGCCCDIPSHLYSFSFARNPNWSHAFPGFQEIAEYLKGVVDSHDIRKFIQFNTEVLKAEWDESNKVWHLTVQTEGEKPREVEANIVLVGTGLIREVNIPEKLVNNFSGPWVHTAQWREDFEYKNKTIAVIGNGASGVQIIPSIAPEVTDLYVFQRTPSWIGPKNNYKFSETWKFFLRWCPPAQLLYRWYIFLRFETLHPAFMRGSYLSNYFSSAFNKLLTSKLETEVPSEVLRKGLQPTYEIGCKRIAFSDDFLPTFSRENVHLITDPITHVDGNAIYTGTGTRTKVDGIVLATGFHTHKFFSPMQVIGKNGLNLEDTWRQKYPESFYGICCREFPNMFLTTGPSSVLGHNSMIFIIECQVNSIIAIIKGMIETNSGSVEIKSEEQQKFNVEVQEQLKNTVWKKGGCKSWYKTENGEIYTIWPKNCISFWNQTRKINISQFDTQPK